MLHGCTIEGMVVGGPAFQSRQLDKGDIIFMIDDEEVDVDSSESIQKEMKMPIASFRGLPT
jgi:hypothetical protein